MKFYNGKAFSYYKSVMLAKKNQQLYDITRKKKKA